MTKFLFLLLALTLSAALHAEESVATIAVDGGNTLSFVKNFQTDHPKFVLILMVGSEGMIQIKKTDDGRFTYHSGNFLMRIRDKLASDDDIVTIAPDAPSDQSSGYSDSFRDSDRHLSDMRKLITYIREQYPQAKVILVGTSRGTISSGVLALKLGHDIDGAIHTSTMTGAIRGAALPLWRLDYSQIAAPQLFIHHHNDNCKFTSFSTIEDKAEKFHIPFIGISGGQGDGGRDPCQAFSNHGFLGVEDNVVLEMKKWIRQLAH